MKGYSAICLCACIAVVFGSYGGGSGSYGGGAGGYSQPSKASYGGAGGYGGASKGSYGGGAGGYGAGGYGGPKSSAADALKSFYNTQDGYNNYNFGYDVQDYVYNNYQSRQESGNPKGEVTGSYALVEPDGSKRTVNYVADWVNGFRATVSDKNGVTRHGYDSGYGHGHSYGGSKGAGYGGGASYEGSKGAGYGAAPAPVYSGGSKAY